MEVPRRRLMTLLNALYDEGVDQVSIEHPCDTIGELADVRLEDKGTATVRFPGALTYQDRREEIPAKFGEQAYEDLPNAQTYLRAVVASGLVDIGNPEAVAAAVERHGYPDLEAGHEPVMLGIDTNIMAWRLPEVLGFDSESGTDDRGRRPTNGYALATGVKEELDRHYRRHDSRDLVAAFGPEFSRLEDQPAGVNRGGLLGLYEYRRLRTSRNFDFVECGQGDPDIVQGYRDYVDAGRKSVLLLSNDYGFIDRAVDAGLPAQHVDFPVDLPRKATGTWTDVVDLLYYLAVLFGVLTLPKVTVYGAWNGKNGRHWQHEVLDLDCRSPKLPPVVERDLAILDATEGA